MPIAFAIDSLLYADDTCIVLQHKSVIGIEKQLIRDFSGLCYWFVNVELSIPFRLDNVKPILFGTKHKLQNTKSFNIIYNGTEIKQHAKV